MDAQEIIDYIATAPKKTPVKVYVRDAEDLPVVAQALDARFGSSVPRVVLHAAICRRELAVEIDGIHA